MTTSLPFISSLLWIKLRGEWMEEFSPSRSHSILPVEDRPSSAPELAVVVKALDKSTEGRSAIVERRSAKLVR